MPILAIAVVVTVDALVHVHTVDQDTGVGKLLVSGKLIDDDKIILARVVGTAYIDTQVHMTGYELRVGHHRDGGGIDEHIVKMSLQQVDALFQRAARKKLRRIGRDRTAGQDIKVRGQTRGLAKRKQVDGRVGQVARDSEFLRGLAENLVQTGLADVQTHYHHFLPRECQARTHVADVRTFTFAGDR